MNQRGRKSSAALAVVSDSGQGSALVMPPGLTTAERGVWLATVNSKPSEWFGTEHIPLLVEYCRHVCRGHVIAEQLKAFDPEWFGTDDGVKRYEKLSGIANKTAGMVARLATNMRITHQSVWRADKASLGARKSNKLWQREPS